MSSSGVEVRTIRKMPRQILFAQPADQFTAQDIKETFAHVGDEIAADRTGQYTDWFRSVHQFMQTYYQCRWKDRPQDIIQQDREKKLQVVCHAMMQASKQNNPQRDDALLEALIILTLQTFASGRFGGSSLRDSIHKATFQMLQTKATGFVIPPAISPPQSIQDLIAATKDLINSKEFAASIKKHPANAYVVNEVFNAVLYNSAKIPAMARLLKVANLYSIPNPNDASRTVTISANLRIKLEPMLLGILTDAAGEIIILHQQSSAPDGTASAAESAAAGATASAVKPAFDADRADRELARLATELATATLKISNLEAEKARLEKKLRLQEFAASTKDESSPPGGRALRAPGLSDSMKSFLAGSPASAAASTESSARIADLETQVAALKQQIRTFMGKMQNIDALLKAQATSSPSASA